MPDLPTITLSQANYARFVAALPSAAQTTIEPSGDVSGATDTAALQAAITAMAAVPRSQRLPILLGGGGIHYWSAAFTGVPAGCEIAGVGMRQTEVQIVAAGDVTFFTLDTFQSSPADYFHGKAYGFVLRNLYVQIPGASYAGEGSRAHTLVQDNGSGSMTFDRVSVAGFKRGIWAAYGSDFTYLTECELRYNDVGVYFGPRSEQIKLDKVMFLGNREALVLDGATTGTSECYYIDSGVANVTFDGNTTTRSGVTRPPVYNYDTVWTFQNDWHESNADGSGKRIPPRFFWIKGNDAGLIVRGIHLRDTYVVAGGPSDGTRAVLELDGGTHISMDDTLVTGSAMTYAVKVSSAAPRVTQRNTRASDGSAIARFGTSGPGALHGCRYYDDTTGVISTMFVGGKAVVNEMRDLGEGAANPAVRTMHYSSGIIGFAFQHGGVGGPWFERIKIDVQARQVIFENLKLGYLAANVLGVGPTTGFRSGVCTTAGRPSAVTMGVGTQMYDSTLSKPIWSDGVVWKDATGSQT